MRDVMRILSVPYRKVGGLHFFRVGRLSMSFCVCKPKRRAS